MRADTTEVAAPQVPVLHWTSCDGGFQCATARVPLGRKQPGGEECRYEARRDQHPSNLPYQDSLATSHDLANPRLLTVQGYGQTDESNPSTCAVNYEISYLLTGALPAAGTVCQDNATPFPSS
jgi:hypothetical protein